MLGQGKVQYRVYIYLFVLYDLLVVALPENIR